jgi:N-dimethylarginine dimethylaminohydrolase
MGLIPAAYHGRRWMPRRASLAEDVRAGRHWSARSSNSEYQPLREVMLAPPDPALPPVTDPDAVQYLAPVDFAVLHDELNNLAHCYESLGVRVHRLSTRDTLYNMMFVRDLFAMTPEGAIVARMASEVRAGEERHAARALATLDVPILRTVSGTGTFEGADMLWARPDLALVGTGNRTNAAGLAQVSACLPGVDLVEVPLPRSVQHLLGLVQIVDRDLVVIRTELTDAGTKQRLREAGLALVELPESEEIRHRQAMNFVVVAPRRVVMVAGAPHVETALSREGIEVAARVRVHELLKAAGGIGCATGIVWRQAAAENGDSG